ncbi:kinase-like domain-containing protein [Hygrophoropsis aurantiaca]|uniref:Kinase-like domain-containing protein n=1 Tax=Hygrophoropsis aurantiaca TaxID=72124 RepID=A0ACB8A3Q1_9AGAM|nr:kinase-like domain-containing protein [Hygrophoropsis aurantiaca]
MSMSHSFVVAKLVPTESVAWTLCYGIQVAGFLNARPFLALRMPVAHIGLGKYYDPADHILFLVSRKKPAQGGPCFTLGPAFDQPEESKTLHVRPGPSLSPDGHTLYVHTFPKIFERLPHVNTGRSVPAPAEFPHHLEDSSLLMFCRSVLEQHDTCRQEWTQAATDAQARCSGEEDPVQADWDTWSGRSPREGLYERIIAVQTVSSSTISYVSSGIQVILFSKLTAEYSWSGVTAAHRCAAQRTLTPPSAFTGNTPTFSSDLMACASSLNSMKIPFDGEYVPVADEDGEIEWEWDDDPEADFASVPQHKPATPSSHIKAIAFDLLDTIFDRNTAIENALRLLAPLLNFSKQQLLEAFFECEGLRLRDRPHAPHVDIVRGTLEDASSRIGVDCHNSTLEDALHTILRPGLHAYARKAVNSLSKRGYTLLALPFPDISLSSLSPLKIRCGITDSLAWFAQMPRIFPELLERARAIHPDIDSSQILVVTSGPYRIAEPANAAGFPVALVRRPDSLEPQVDLGTYDPTLVATGLRDLCAQLKTQPIQPVPPIKRPLLKMEPFRVCDLYQVTKMLGSGSFGRIFGAFHVLAGEEVALKVEMPTGKPDETCVLPYEAQVYRLLPGHTGIPLLRWYGMDGGAHVLILDKLGVNLQQLRQLCRNTLSLRSICALALQMLDRVEFAHSRGVIIRDIKPENFAMGVGSRASAVHLFDLGLAKLFVDPHTGQHIPPREGRVGLGTPRYASHNVHFGRKQSRRDDLEALGNVLLFLLHGRLPWQGIYAPSIEAKLLRIGEMKAGAPFRELLARSPPEFTKYSEHVRGLRFEEKPDYTLLARIFRERMEREGWVEDDGCFDWAGGAVSLNLKGTLVPDEYKWDVGFTSGDLVTLDASIARFH